MSSIFHYLTDRAFKYDLRTSGTQPTLSSNSGRDVMLSQPRQVPMRVLPLGLCRTSEVSLGQALKILGYKPFGMAEGTKSPKQVFSLWKEAVDAKYNISSDTNADEPQKKKWSKKEFDSMLSSYDCTIGVPACLFPEELISAYPDAKVILNTRSTKSWVDSMRVAAGEMLTWGGIDFLVRWDTNFSGPLFNLIRSQMRVMCDTNDFRPDGYSAKFFEEHGRRVKALVPKDQLLEFRSSDGWEPLCKFLECDIPNQPFPRIDSDEDDEMIMKFQRSFWAIGIARAVCHADFWFVGLPALLAGGWIYQDQLLNLMQSTYHSLNRLV